MSSSFPRAASRCWYAFAAGSIPTETAASRGAIPRACRAALCSRDRSWSFSASALPMSSRTVLPGDPRLDEIGDAPALLVAAVDRPIEVLRDGLHLSRILYRCEVDHHIEGRPAKRGLRHERAHADVARRHRAGARDTALARIEKAPRRLGDLERDPRRGKERGLHAFVALLFLFVRLARKLHRLGDARVSGAVILDEV